MFKGCTRLTTLLGAMACAASAPAAAAAQVKVATYSPWAALSAFASQSSSAALCGSASSRAMSSPPKKDSSGCVLPAVDSAPVGTSVAPYAATAAGLGTLPLLVGLATLAGLAALALGSGNGPGGDAIGARPVSPP
jgi:hypothetical protein